MTQVNKTFETDIARFTEKQMEAVAVVDSGKKFILYGGAVGGGKSYWLRWMCVRRLFQAAMQGIQHARVMLACENFPTLKDRQISKIGTEFPAWLGALKVDHQLYGRCFLMHRKWGSGVICFRNLDDPSKYQSAEFMMIAVDELTKNPHNIMTDLRMRLRWPDVPDNECQFIAGTNPGGIGHGWIKALWMDNIFPDEWRTPTDYTGSFAYIPSTADDNPHIGSDYYAMLQTLPPNIRKAFRDGDWNIFVGQAFPNFGAPHIIPDCSPPDNAPIIMSFDWGFGKPFSVGWWFVDNDGRLIRFDEWYGYNGAANEGLRIPDSEIATEIIARENSMGVSHRQIMRLSGHDCFAKKPDYHGGGQAPSTAEIFAQHGLYLTCGDADRAKKIRNFRERLNITGDERPMLQVCERCIHTSRTIPNLVCNKNNIEDIDTMGEDHIYDEIGLVCNSRAGSAWEVAIKPSRFEARMQALEGGDEWNADDYEEEDV